MEPAYILAAVRTPIGKRGGALAAVRPDDLLALVLRALIERTRMDPADIGEVFTGCANQAGEDNRNVARMASLLAGFPEQVPAVTVNRLCASGLESVVQAMRSIWVGEHTLAIASGVESMSRAPWVMEKPAVGYPAAAPQVFDTALGWRFPNPKLAERFPLESMGETAENVAQAYRISRPAQDAFALQSHQRAIDAWACGRFAEEVVPLQVVHRKQAVHVQKDEGPRSDTSLEKLGGLRPVFRSTGTVTAGNASTLNDGAAALLLGTRAMAAKLNIEPLGCLLGATSVGVDPRLMGIGPVPAIQRVLQRTTKALQDVDLVEVNEAFAAQTLAVMQALELPADRVNVNGGAIALGHPLGCSGARILTTLVHEMRRRRAKLGVASLCVGVGQGTAAVVARGA